MSEYKIELGIGLRDSDFNNIKSKIKSLEDEGIKIKLDDNTIDTQIKNIETRLRKLDGIKIDLGNSISFDSNTAIKSAQQVGQKIGETTTKALKQSLNIDDTINKEVLRLMNNWGIGGKKGTKAFDNAFNEIKQAVISYRKGLASITNNPDMNPEKMLAEFAGSANIRKVMSAIANNKKVVDDNQKKIDEKVLEYLKPYRDSKSGYKVQIPEGVKGAYLDKGVFSKERSRLGAAFNTNRGTTFESFISDFNDVTGNLIKSTNAIDQYFEFVDLIKDIDSRKQSKWQMSESQLLSSDYLRERDIADDIFASMDAISAKEKELVQSSNATTDAIVQNQQRQQEAHENSSKANLDRIKSELEQAKQREKEINSLIEDNDKRFQEATISGDAAGILDSQNRMDELDAESKAIKAHIDTLNASYKQATNARKNITQQINGFDDAKQTLKSLDFNTNSLDKMIGDFEELGVTVKKVTHSLNKDGSITFNVEGIDEAKNVVKAVKTLKSDGSFGSFSSSVSQDLKASEKFLKQQKQTVANLTNQINQMNRSAIDQNASRPIKDTSHLDTLSSKYDEITAAIQRMNNASDSNTFADEKIEVEKLISEYKSLVKEFKNAENVSNKMKGTDFASGLDIAKNDLEKFKAQAKDFPQITATIKELDNAIENVGDASSLNKFNDQLRVARSELAKVKSETTAINRNEKVGINVSGLESKIADIQRISPEIDRFETEIDGAKVSVQSLLNNLKQVKTQGDFSVVNSRFKAFADAAKAAGIAVSETAAKTKAAFAKDIKYNIDVGNFDNQMDAMRTKFNSLSDANDDLRRSFDATEDAYEAMMKAANANSGDEVADREKLIQKEKEYAAALEKTNNLIKQQARADKIDADKIKLQDNRDIFQSKIDAWLTKNSAATKRFGADLLELRAKAEKADQVELNHLEKELTKIDKAADKAGLKMQSFSDRISSKLKEYMAYISVAEVFMYAEQALSSMFEQVKLIDSAMTELKKVTDETDASYDRFLTNAASRAKEIGTTIDGLVSSTADFARLGYDFADAQGLAEVANIYAVVGDDIEGVEGATQSLISTMAAFKDEMSGLSNTDFAMSIIDKLNEVANNYSISSGGLGEALQRSASSLEAGNNTLDESISLITAANEVVQNPEKVGNAMKTISMRIRSAKSEMEEMGENTDGMVESTATLRAEIKALSGVDIMASATEFKSTYQILDELSHKWEGLSDIAQATIIEKMAGKHQGNVFSSLMENFDTARNALETSLNSAGSAMKEHEKWQQSLEAENLPRHLEISDLEYI